MPIAYTLTTPASTVGADTMLHDEPTTNDIAENPWGLDADVADLARQSRALGIEPEPRTYGAKLWDAFLAVGLLIVAVACIWLFALALEPLPPVLP